MLHKNVFYVRFLLPNMYKPNLIIENSVFHVIKTCLKGTYQANICKNSSLLYTSCPRTITPELLTPPQKKKESAYGTNSRLLHFSI
jgi:hypothetical protein